jgi:hypothetical protein
MPQAAVLPTSAFPFQLSLVTARREFCTYGKVWHPSAKQTITLNLWLIGHNCARDTLPRQQVVLDRVSFVPDRHWDYLLTTPTARQARLVHQKFQLQKFQEVNINI